MGCGSSNSLNTRPEVKSNNYAFNPAEKKLYEDLIKENPRLEDEYLVFYKQDIFVSEKDGFIYREYQTVKMVKDKYPYSGLYVYTPRYIYLNKVNIIDIRVNNIKSKDYKYEEAKDNFKISIPYTVQKEDDPLFTFEVVFSFRRLFADTYAQIGVEYDSESCFSLTISCKGFHFYGNYEHIQSKYKFEETKSKITFSGTVAPDDSLDYVEFNLVKDTGVLLDNFPNSLQTDFYFIDKADKKAIEDSINSIQITPGSHNWVFSRDIIKLVDNKAYVKAYEVIFAPYSKNEPIREQDFEFDIHEMPDLKITNFKIANKPAKSNHKIENGCCFFKPKLSFAEGEYFRTIEFDYTFTLKYDKENYCPIDIYKPLLIDGSTYELYIKKDHGRRIEFKRDANTTSSKEYELILKGSYKTFDDDLFYFNVIQVYNYK